MKIVLIDDSATTLTVLRMLCAKACDGELVTFTDSQSAMDYLAGTPVTLIIVDYSMPGITGTELIRRLRASPHHTHTPIVMVTANQLDMVRNRAHELGATAVINKPINPRAFQEMLRDIWKPSRAES